MLERMEAVVMRAGKLRLDQVDIPTPGPGQLLARSTASGVCGSDLHLIKQPHQYAERIRQLDDTSLSLYEPERDLIMGHEFCAEVVEAPAGSAFKSGDRIVSLPLALIQGQPAAVGLSHQVCGAWGSIWCWKIF